MGKVRFKILAILALVALNAAMIVPEIAMAQSIKLPVDAYKDNFLVAKGDNALDQTTNVVTKAINAGRMLIAGVAILLGLIGLVQMVVGQDKEEAVGKAKRTILYSMIAIAIIALSADLAQIFDLSGGGLLGAKGQVTDRLQLFDNTVRIVITFIKYIIGAVAILMLVLRGLVLITQGSNEEETGKAKASIGYILVGLFGLIFVDNLIRNVFYKIDSPGNDLRIDLGQGIREVVGFTNLLVGWIGPIAIITLVAGGFMYAISFGNEDTQEKAKKMMTTSLIGIVIIYGAFGIVSTLISGSL